MPGALRQLYEQGRGHLLENEVTPLLPQQPSSHQILEWGRLAPRATTWPASWPQAHEQPQQRLIRAIRPEELPDQSTEGWGIKTVTSLSHLVSKCFVMQQKWMYIYMLIHTHTHTHACYITSLHTYIQAQRPQLSFSLLFSTLQRLWYVLWLLPEYLGFRLCDIKAESLPN